MVSGPSAAMLLADQGADVIKVENPDGGDHTRASANQRAGYSAAFLRVRLETLCLITVPCEPPCEESDVGDKNPCLCGGD